jgi:hypothetical protein
MLQFANRTLGRKLLLALVASIMLACAGASAGTAYALNCNVLDYMDRLAVNPRKPNEQYLFACRYLWHSTDSGSVWNRVDVSGLPFGLRDGYISSNGQPGRLYLGILIPSQSSWQCWDCAWKTLRPAIYTSTDGGQTWIFTYKFKVGQVGSNEFIGLYADPAKERFLYAIIKNSDQITFYASGTSGQFWKPICTEYYDIGRTCHLPTAVMQFQNDSLPAIEFTD